MLYYGHYDFGSNLLDVVDVMLSMCACNLRW
jgi:hypothetical protein